VRRYVVIAMSAQPLDVLPQPDYDQTTIDLARLRIVAGSADRELQAVVELAAAGCGTARAAINIITADVQHQVAAAGTEASDCAREHSMCGVVLREPALVVVNDASSDPRFSSNPSINGELDNVRFYASVPLLGRSGNPIGRLCVFDVVVRELSAQEGRLLSVLGARVMDLLELHVRHTALEHSVVELSEARDELNRSNELLSHFAGQVSHDLRSPLTAILANTELLAEEPAIEDDKYLRSLAEGAVAAALRMVTMINEVLAYARLGADLDLTTVGLDAILDDVLRDLDPVIRSKHAEIVREPLPEVSVDRSQLYSVLLNLTSNALKFMPADARPLLHVAAEQVGDAWQITVADNGTGIPAERREAIFELYERDNRAVAGSGIGLATVRRIVEAHGGTITVGDSDLGGACFTFTLPVHPGQE